MPVEQHYGSGSYDQQSSPVKAFENTLGPHKSPHAAHPELPESHTSARTWRRLETRSRQMGHLPRAPVQQTSRAYRRSLLWVSGLSCWRLLTLRGVYLWLRSSLIFGCKFRNQAPVRVILDLRPHGFGAATAKAHVPRQLVQD